MAVFLLFAFSGLQIRRAYRPKQEGTKHGSAATLVRPGFGSSAGVLRTPRGCQGRGGHPSPQAAWGGGAVSHPPAPPDNNFEAPPASTEKGTDGPARARDAQPARLPARLPARKRRVSRRADGASPGAQTARLPARRPARLPARNRRVLRRAPDASTDAYPARLEARSRHASAACEVFAF